MSIYARMHNRSQVDGSCMGITHYTIWLITVSSLPGVMTQSDWWRSQLTTILLH